MTRSARPALTAALVGLTLAFWPAPAAASELVTIEAPSSGNVDPADVSFNGADHPRTLRANVLLPDGYDGTREFPVLFLLHGVGDAYNSWARADRGDVQNTVGGLEAVVVMPEAAKGFYANHWNGGRRCCPGWERYYLDELIPLVESRFRIRAGRRWHAIAGLSMGGLGATYLASQRPDYFGAAATFSGFVSHQRPETDIGLTAVGGVSYGQIFGPQSGFYATGHNPTRLTENLRHTRLYVTVGNGVAEPGVPGSAATIAGGGLVEAGLYLQAEELVAAARAARVDTTYVPLAGVHDWPYWRRHLRAAITWGLFEPAVEDPPRFVYSTVASSGRMWDLTYRFEQPPTEVIRFERAEALLRATGSGRVRIENAQGCGFIAALPFERPLPACSADGRIRLSVRPRRARRGQRERFTFTATTGIDGRRVPVAGARLRLGRRTAETNRGGRATIDYRPTGRSRLLRPRATRRGLRPGRVTIRVLPARVVPPRSSTRSDRGFTG